MRISIRTIPHSSQRYPTTGDWWFINNPADGNELFVVVSEMNDWRYEVLVGLHETIEALLCFYAGIPEEKVSAFDRAYEAARDWKFGERADEPPTQALFLRPFDTITETSEPGDDSRAPYYVAHQIATGIERILAALLGVSWNDYEQASIALYEGAAT